MLDDVLKKGDGVVFLPQFGAATVTPLAKGSVIKGDKAASIGGKNYCSASNANDVKGLIGTDFGTKYVPCIYFTGSHSIPGLGQLSVESLNSNQLSQKCEISENKKAILVGQKFNAVLKVISPAKMPPPASTPDPMSKHLGMNAGEFIAINSKFQAE